MKTDFTGDVSFEALGKSYTLKLGTKAMRKIEIAVGKPMPVIGKMLDKEETASIDLVAKVFWGALQHHHPEVSVDDVDDILDAIGLDQAGPLIGQAFEAAQQPKKGGDNRPPVATTGPTGRR
ncbi:hypothetical protein GCM10007908_03720 [Rhizobium albus]|nr:hypothetical protein GCM10007908_03720 [Rhizobium albus]